MVTWPADHGKKRPLSSMVPLLADHVISPSTTLFNASYSVASICKTPSDEITVDGVEMTI